MESIPKAPASTRTIYSKDDADLILALWGDSHDITPEMLTGIRAFADFIKQREELKK